MRATDAAEKVSVVHPEWLKPYQAELRGRLAEAVQPELPWHLAQRIARLPLTPGERRRAVDPWQLDREDGSSIVRPLALLALADISQKDGGSG